jgi:hypothetical protein
MKDNNRVSKKSASIPTIRLAARVVGTIWLAICLFGFISFFLEGSKPVNSSRDILGIATIVCFLIAFCGLIIAWWRSGIGGFMSLFGFITAAVLFKLNPKYIFSLLFFVIVLLPSILYLADWWFSAKETQNPKSI